MLSIRLEPGSDPNHLTISIGLEEKQALQTYLALFLSTFHLVFFDTVILILGQAYIRGYTVNPARTRL